MSSNNASRNEGAALVGVGAAACAVCCAGPILGFLAAIGLGTAIGVAVFGSMALIIGAVGIALVIRRRRRQAGASSAVEESPVEIIPRR